MFYVVRAFQGVEFVFVSYVLSLIIELLMYYLFERNYKKIRNILKPFLGKRNA